MTAKIKTYINCREPYGYMIETVNNSDGKLVTRVYSKTPENPRRHIETCPETENHFDASKRYYEK